MNTIVSENAISLNIAQSEIGNEVVDSINARDLHIQLWSKQDFSDWIKNRIKKYGFIASDDYTIKLWNRSDSGIWKWRTDYILTLDTAKEIAMVENNEAGRKIRKYLIEVEKRYRQNDIIWNKPIDLQTKAIQMLVRSWIMYQKEINEMKLILENQNQEIKTLQNNQKILELKNTQDTKEQILILDYTIWELAKEVWVSRNKLFEWLRFNRFLNKDNTPRKNYLWKYFIQKKVRYRRGSWTWLYLQTFCLPKWFEYIKWIFGSTALS